MAFTLSKLGTVAELRASGHRMAGKLARMAKISEEQIGNAVQVSEVGGSAFAWGYANARFGEDGELKIAGIPLDLGVGVALTALGSFGALGKKYAEHGVNLGSGSLAAYAYRTGFQLGADAADEENDTSQPTTSNSAARTNAAIPRSRINGAPASVTAGWDGQTYTVQERQ